MEGCSFVTPVTGLNRPNTGKEYDDDIFFSAQTRIISSNSINELISSIVNYGVLFEVRTKFLNNTYTCSCLKGLNFA
jgi:hypothetical protein